ncbi:MAG: hypothetical protein IT530_16150 [Burkholderiales bacterium]|nr:hypothetical protein [Burkholderiales bacterium]
MSVRPDNVATAREAWGASCPDWIFALAQACDLSSQAQVGKRLGVSGAVVNQVLRCRYAGRMDRIEARARGELMRATVQCPVMGEISSRQCQDEQRRAFATTNPQRVRVYHACRGTGPFAGQRCIHYRGDPT